MNHNIILVVYTYQFFLALEDRVKELDKELSRYIDMEAQYHILKERVSSTEEMHVQLRATITAKDAV